GTVSEGKLLEAGKNNYLMALSFRENQLGIASLDISTGDFFVTQILEKNQAILLEKLSDEIGRLRPSEILLNSALFESPQAMALIEKRFGIMVNLLPEQAFKNADQRLTRQFQVFSLAALGIDNRDQAILASGGLLHYIDTTQKRVLNHIKTLKFYASDDFMLLDLSTRRNLELTQTLRTLEKKGSLLGVLDKTVTAMGGRTLRRWVEAPLLKQEAIINRQASVFAFYKHPEKLKSFQKILSQVYDFERLCGKISFGSATPKDLLSLKSSLASLPQINDFLKDLNCPGLDAVFDERDLLTDVYNLLNASISEDAPLLLKDGQVIKNGYNLEIDSYREATENGQDWIRDLETIERQKTGIKNLKIKYNRIFGYFLEVTKSYLDAVPESYIRKQTLANAERFFTPELKEMENKILGAQEGLLRCETEVFQEIRQAVLREIGRIQKKASQVAELDALYSLAVAALNSHYVCPEITDDDTIEIQNGRHPVVEEMIGQAHFIGNDCYLDRQDQKMLIITGPNMAGKSTFIRQVAIITLMAQIGSFVPADAAKIGIVDRIFTRVGASDDLASGQSTFMVEMTEVANILKNATAKSLIILDEIGRGTSTFDGISIAWAVVEHLYDDGVIGAKTLFATHYHELTELETLKPGIKNFSIQLKETPDGVIFLRKIKAGAADQSYGIEVAKLAGFPESVLKKAQTILTHLESGEETVRKEMQNLEPPHFEERSASQLSFFELPKAISPAEEKALGTLRELKLDEMSPREVMNIIYDLRTKISE
ncbi:MAG: DNA mismatch repair protein MutS, partial [Eubacteriaceae bacterium]